MTDPEVATVLQRALETNQQVVQVNAELMATIERLKAPADFGMAVMDDGQCYGFDTASKMLAPKVRAATGHDIGRDRLIDFLKAEGIIDQQREPYQRFSHHFKVVLKNTPVGMKPTSLLTGKGLAWLLPRLVERYHG